MRTLSFELFNELGGVGLIVWTAEKMQERHDKALSDEKSVF
jgi:hypothetical protein